MESVRLNVLVVEDCWAMRKLLARGLRALNAEALEAGDADEAWKSLQDESVDLALIDAEMPGGEAIGLIGRIRADERSATLPLVLCSGNLGGGCQEQLQQFGPIGYLEKPYEPDALATDLERLFDLTRVLLKAARAA